jgi:general secretion pathway protein G
MDELIKTRIGNSAMKQRRGDFGRRNAATFSIKTFNDSGLTMVELIVVVGILTVLAMLAIPAFNDYRQATKISRSKHEIRNIEKEVTAYFIEKNQLPPTLAAAGVVAVDDPWGNTYVYVPGGGALNDFLGDPINTDFDLYSKGRNGLSNPDPSDPTSTDDIARSGDGAYVGLR